VYVRVWDILKTFDPTFGVTFRKGERDSWGRKPP